MNEILLLHDVVGHSSDEQVGVEVEAVRPLRALALDLRLVVHAQHAVAPVAGHDQLVPATPLDWHRADHRSRARARVEPDMGSRVRNQSRHAFALERVGNQLFSRDE